MSDVPNQNEKGLEQQFAGLGLNTSDSKDWTWNPSVLKTIVGGVFSSSDFWRSNVVREKSQMIENQDLFVALEKEKNIEHSVEVARKNGAVAAIISKPVNTVLPTFLVSNTVEALHKMAIYRRNSLDVKAVIAITGSAGKTTTKDMLDLVLRNHHATHCTEFNYNGQMGLPLTIVNCPIRLEYLVVEMGANHAGEISKLMKIARPNIAVITNIGYAHIEFFESLECTVEVKAEIFEGIEEDGILVLNRDDKYYEQLVNLSRNFPNISKIISFGCSDLADVCLLGVSWDNTIVASVKDRKIINYSLSFYNKGMIYNSLASLAVLTALTDEPERYMKELVNFTVCSGHGNLIDVNFEGKNITIMDHSYSSNPDALAVSLKHLSNYSTSGRKIAILGDMRELGHLSRELHISLKNYISSDVDVVVLVGEEMRVLKNLISNVVFCYLNVDALLDDFMSLENNDVIMIKGSHSMHLSKVVDYLLIKTA